MESQRRILMYPMTPKEDIVMLNLIRAHKHYVQMEELHPSDMQEWVFHMHGLQHLLGMRILQREHPELYPTYKKEAKTNG
jgi:hypothetical protein